LKNENEVLKMELQQTCKKVDYLVEFMNKSNISTKYTTDQLLEGILSSRNLDLVHKDIKEKQNLINQLHQLINLNKAFNNAKNFTNCKTFLIQITHFWPMIRAEIMSSMFSKPSTILWLLRKNQKLNNFQWKYLLKVKKILNGGYYNLENEFNFLKKKHF
jgi:hypothetical protein